MLRPVTVMWVEPSSFGTISETVHSCQDLFGQYGYDLLLDHWVKRLFLPDPSRGILHVHNFLQALVNKGVITLQNL